MSYFITQSRPPRLLERIATDFVQLGDDNRVFDVAEPRRVLEVGTLWYASESAPSGVEIMARARAELMDYFGQEDRRDDYCHLVELVASTRNRDCARFSHWKWYHRKYVAIANALFQGGVISRMEYHGFFWMGIPLVIRDRLKRRLRMMAPQHNRNQPYPIWTVNAAARLHFEAVGVDDDDDNRSDSLMSLTLSDE
ncbi:hypothetical protein APHAL10511_005631 [Amanita phalloides]|nr:hypothetical protein APHAL10511_005631 [Amanita phalloides]